MINSVTLVGRLTKDVDLKYTPNGLAVATFTLAVNRAFTNQQGEKETDFINIVVWRKPAENVSKFCKKGSLIGITGRIQTRSYDGQDGKRVYVTEVLAENIQYLDTRSGSNNNGDSNSIGNQNNSNQRNSRIDENPFANDGSQIDIKDDDLPF